MRQKTIQILSAFLFLGLLLWGGYGLIAYLGVPVHDAVLLNDVAQVDVGSACPAGGLLCRGLHAFFPFLLYSLRRMDPVRSYVIFSLVFYGAFVMWRLIKTGEARLKLRFKAWYFLPLFLLATWLLFTVFSNGVNDNFPVRQIVEPTALAYGNVGESVLQALQKSFQELQAGKCLSLLGQSDSGAKIYSIANFCMQKSFFIRVVPQMFAVIVFLFECLVLGRFLLSLLRVKPRSLFTETLLSAGAGVCGWIVLLWIAAVLSIFTYQIGWGLAIFLPVLLLRHTLYWFSAFFRRSFEIDLSWRSMTIFLGWLLLSYLALNFLTVLRPFPIGWDDLGSYINRPRLLVSYGHFIYSMSPFQWEYLTSLGFLLFGYDSTFGATFAMLINWSAGLLALLSVLLFASAFLGKRRGLLSALLYYSLPLVGHFSFADMKIDNGVFTMGVLAMFCIFSVLFPEEEGQDAAEQHFPHPLATTGWRFWIPSSWPWLVLGGIFIGFSFSFKATAVMVFFPLLLATVGVMHWSSLLAALSFAVLMLIQAGALNLASIAKRIGGIGAGSLSVIPPLLVILTVAFAAVAFLRLRRRVLPLLGAALFFLMGFGIAVAPWMLHNNVLAGSAVPRIMFSAPNNLTPVFDYGNLQKNPAPNVHQLPEDLKVDMNNPACHATGGSEELDRYWGFGGGWAHYLTLPWRTVMNLDSAGYYVTTIPALLLFPLLLLLPYFWSKRGRWLRWLFLFTALILVQWVFLASGVPWYGIGVFLGLVVGLEALAARAPDPLNRWLASLLILFSVLIAFGNRFWQFDQQRNLLEYSMGKISAEALRLRTIPYYDDIRTIVTDRHDSLPQQPYLYRVGTFIPYFIPKNLEIIGLTDNQLDNFNCLNQEHNPELTLRRLKALGFNSIIFDTNTATIEKDLNGSLHKKVQEFIDFLNNPSLHFQVLINDANQGVAFVLLP